MIKDISLVSSVDGARFLTDVAEKVDEFQNKGLIVDIQYRNDNHKYTAFITGRTKNNVQG